MAGPDEILAALFDRLVGLETEPATALSKKARYVGATLNGLAQASGLRHSTGFQRL